MSYELPALPDIAAAALAVGLLFCLRFALALRRLRAEMSIPSGSARDLWGAWTRGSFGADREPERRHAVRQLVVGVVFLTVSAILYGWLGWTAAGGSTLPGSPGA